MIKTASTGKNANKNRRPSASRETSSEKKKSETSNKQFQRPKKIKRNIIEIA